jgi:putative ABC transport system permease protein
MDSLVKDLHFAFRMLLKNPGFAVVAVLTLALGIGANAAIFSVINTVLLKPLPYPDPDRLVLVWESIQDRTNIVSAPNYFDWRQQNRVFESMALFDSAGRGYNLSEGNEPERVSGVRVSASFFDVLGMRPFLGRIFLPDEEILGKDHEVILGYGLWKRRYGGDRSLIGKTIRVDGESFTVVGVMPPEFHFQFWSNPRELWVPVGYTEGDKGRGSHSFIAIARLKPGVTLAQARVEMDTIGRRLSKEYPQDNAGESATATAMSEFQVRSLRPTLLTLFAVVGFVLLIACVNVANLVLARSATRQKELAIRRALGAGRFRIMRQLMTESVLLGLVGGVAGLFVASFGLSLFKLILPFNLKFLAFRPLESIPMDGRVFGFALAISLLTGMLFGLVPAFTTRRNDLNEPLKEGAGRGATPSGRNRLRQALVASEVALALVVLACAGLMVESMVRLLRVDPGFNSKNVLTMDISQPQVDLYYGPPVHAHFCQDLEERVGALAGIVSASAISHLPLEGRAGRGFEIEGEADPGPEHQPAAGYSVTCPGYFRTLGIPIRQGREFVNQDTPSAPGVIVINETMARRYWPNKDPIGRRIKLGYFDSKEPWLTVVGVAKDVRHWGLDEKVEPEFFRPYTQAGWPSMTVVVRTASAPDSYAISVKKAMAEIEPEQPVSNIGSMEEVVRDSVGTRRFPMLLLTVFALLALALAAVGITGVVSYAVVQRTHEIGIRMALGAQPRDVLQLMVQGSMVWSLAGVVVGIIGAMAVTRLLSALLYGVRPTDPWVLGVVSLLLTGVALLASYIPARAATRVDPIVALRYE